MNDYRILVVDDEEDLCEILKFNLENEGYEVDTANSAEEALKMNISSYHLLLLDVMMGEISGFKMANILKKAKAAGNDSISLCERGTSFGYGNLVVDMRSLEIMKRTGHPVVFDATHSVQLPGAQGTCSGGQREFVPVLAKAAASIGVAGMFMEVHPDPDRAPCDGPNRELPVLLEQLQAFDKLAKGI